MSVYNYLLLLVPVVGMAMLLAAFYWTDRTGRDERLHPGEVAAGRRGPSGRRAD